MSWSRGSAPLQSAASLSTARSLRRSVKERRRTSSSDAAAINCTKDASASALVSPSAAAFASAPLPLHPVTIARHRAPSVMTWRVHSIAPARRSTLAFADAAVPLVNSSSVRRRQSVLALGALARPRKIGDDFVCGKSERRLGCQTRGCSSSVRTAIALLNAPSAPHSSNRAVMTPRLISAAEVALRPSNAARMPYPRTSANASSASTSYRSTSPMICSSNASSPALRTRATIGKSAATPPSIDRKPC